MSSHGKAIDCGERTAEQTLVVPLVLILTVTGVCTSHQVSYYNTLRAAQQRAL